MLSIRSHVDSRYPWPFVILLLRAWCIGHQCWHYLGASQGFPDGLVVMNPLLHDLVTEQQCKILTTGKTGWRGEYENSVYNFCNFSISSETILNFQKFILKTMSTEFLDLSSQLMVKKTRRQVDKCRKKVAKIPPKIHFRRQQHFIWRCQ